MSNFIMRGHSHRNIKKTLIDFVRKIMNINFKTSNNENIFSVKTFNGPEYSLPLLTFNRLNSIPFITHCFSTRLGGTSEGIFSSLNLSSSRGDNPDNVRTNYTRIAAALDADLSDLVFSRQTHTTNVLRVDQDTPVNNMENPTLLNDIDGLITNVPGLVLTTFYADCVPLFFVDTKQKAIGLSHSGWRGTAARMGLVTIKRMYEEYKSEPENIICAIGPSICGNCYEISSDVAEVFYENFKHSPYFSDILKKKNKTKYMLNLQIANKSVLIEAGISEENIVVSNICTACNSDLLFSHRASAGKRGNLGAFMKINTV